MHIVQVKDLSNGKFSEISLNFTAEQSVLYFFLIFFIFSFSFIFISWRLINLQYCSGFCHTLTWINHGFTCILNYWWSLSASYLGCQFGGLLRSFLCSPVLVPAFCNSGDLCLSCCTFISLWGTVAFYSVETHCLNSVSQFFSASPAFGNEIQLYLS